MHKIVISLFDYTTEFVKPWAKEGYTCFCVDIQHPYGYSPPKGNIIKVGLPVEDFAASLPKGDVIFLAAFPPCTDLAVSGAAHFRKKEASNPHYREEALSLVYLARDLGEKLQVPYLIENPISVISTEWRKPDYIFHPWEYGMYLPEGDRHPDYPEIIEPNDRYNKKTCLWTNALFVMPGKKPTEKPVGYSKQHKLLGGKSIRTKNIRSATPRGFSLAVFEANHTTH